MPVWILQGKFWWREVPWNAEQRTNTSLYVETVITMLWFMERNSAQDGRSRREQSKIRKTLNYIYGVKATFSEDGDELRVSVDRERNDYDKVVEAVKKYVERVSDYKVVFI